MCSRSLGPVGPAKMDGTKPREKTEEVEKNGIEKKESEMVHANNE